MALHGDLDATLGIHKPAAFEYSNEANRLADSRAAGPKDAAGNYRPLVDGAGGDIGKLAYQSDTSKYYTLTGIGTPGGGYGSQGTLTWAPVAATGAGTGDMSGPGSSVSGNVVSWNNTAGTLTADSGKVAADLVTGPASATDTAIVLMDGTTGRLIKESVVTVNGSGDITTAGTVDGKDVSSLIAAVSEDTSPTLGGDLDVGSYDIVSASDANIDIKPDGIGELHLGNAAGSGDIVLQQNINMNSKDLVSVSNGHIDIEPNGSGDIKLGSTTGTGELKVNLKMVTGQTDEDLEIEPNGTGVVKVSSGGYTAAHALTSSASISIDYRVSNVFTVTLAHNTDFTLAATPPAGTTLIVIITQDGTGSRTATWDTATAASFIFPGGTSPTLSTASGAVDCVSFVSNGTSLLGVAQLAFA